MTTITQLSDQHKKMLQLRWIIHATAFFITTINGNNDDDIYEGVGTAEKYFNNGSSGANAVYQGYDAARKQIIKRVKRQSRPMTLGEFYEHLSIDRRILPFFRLKP